MNLSTTMSVIVGGIKVDTPTYVRTPSPDTFSSSDDYVEIGATTTSPEDDRQNFSCHWDYQSTLTSSNDHFSFFMYGVLLNIISLLGIAGNVISITVLSRPKMRSSINCCLIGLSVFDMIVALTAILMWGIPEICRYTVAMMWYYRELSPKITPFIYPLALIAHTGSAYLTVTVTLERYVAVCQPLKVRSICTYGRAKIYVLSVTLFAVLYNLPRWWEITYKECDIGEDVRHFFYVATPLRNDNNYKQIYIMWMFLVVMYLVPFISLTVFNSFIYRRVRAANQERQRLSRLEKKEIGLAVMLLVVVTVFFVCNVLAFIINVLELLDIVVPELTATSNVLVCVNSSVNFIIYCIFGQKFRRLFLKMFCGRIVKTSARRDTTFRESRTLTNGRSTQIIRMSSWNGSHRSRSDSQAAAKLDGRHDSASSWRPFSKYSSVPLGDSSTPRTASSSFTPSRSPSLVPPAGPGESDHAL
ncbi:FMRFamide receptor-like [Penaeus monodon]|uniref:FMRFamide receptor-like n=1 Tax=Penaeus monodon TaxID=6687 RepID=UPI0018A73A1D|nr:FMRFamide receptor-like [Penaeus monodon]